MQLDAIAREGARRMLAAALRAEVAEYLEAAEGQRDEQGHALVTRNGNARPREVTNAALFLASDESSYVNGSTFLVDGGLTAAYVTPE